MTDTGRWIRRTSKPHDCQLPKTRKIHVEHGDLWQCDCLTVWRYYWNYAGDGWEKV